MALRPLTATKELSYIKNHVLHFNQSTPIASASCYGFVMIYLIIMDKKSVLIYLGVFLKYTYFWVLLSPLSFNVISRGNILKNFWWALLKLRFLHSLQSFLLIWVVHFFSKSTAQYLLISMFFNNYITVENNINQNDKCANNSTRGLTSNLLGNWERE